MSYLFINEKGASVSLNANRVVVNYRDGMMKHVPIETLEAIYLFHQVQISTQCTVECLKRGITLSYFSPTGRYFGKLVSTDHVNTARQRQQAKLYHSDFALQLAQSIISAKIHNQSVVLKRYIRKPSIELNEILMEMKRAGQMILRCTAIPEILGYEGIAAKHYFKGLSCIVDSDFAFSGRSKRPPRDEFNSMLSFGYSMLMNEILGRLENKGLNPYFGFVHRDKEKHPTLASDIMEEWRAVIVDSMVLSLVNGHEIHKEDFSHDNDKPGYYLTRTGLSVFLNKYNKKMQAESKYLDYVDYRTSYRRAIDLQINQLVHAIEMEDASVYHPLRLR